MSWARLLWLALRGFDPLWASRFEQLGHSLQQCVTAFDAEAYLTRPNGPYAVALSNKLFFGELLEAMGFRVPEVFGFSASGRWFWRGDGEARLQEACRRDRVVLKPIFGRQGTGVIFAATRDEVLAQHGPADLAVPFLRAGDYARRIWPDSLNSIKLVCFRAQDGRAYLGHAGQRLGSADSDGFEILTLGGLATNIDLRTGEMTAAIKIGAGNRLQVFDAHPHTGVPIRGVVIEHWPEVIATATRLMTAFPMFRYVGWDVIVTDDGVTIVEGNAYPGPSLPQLGSPLLRPSPFADFLRSRMPVSRRADAK